MNDGLVKRLRGAATMSEALAYLLPRSEGSATAKLFNEAADAIEELQQQVEHYHGCMNDWFDAAQEYKAEMPRWVPVTERLPEEGVSVQVCFHSQGGKAQAVSERFVDNRNQSYWSGLCGMKPTHWMPLQESPKEEEA